MSSSNPTPYHPSNLHIDVSPTRPTSTPSPTESAIYTPPLSPLSTPTQGNFSRLTGYPSDYPQPRSLIKTKAVEGDTVTMQPPSPGGLGGSSTLRRSSLRRPNPDAGGAGRRVSAAVSDDDGLIMRDRSEREHQDGSVGRAGGVDVGVTRPKRRLSSLPSLPHPYHSSDFRAISTSSPPSSPGRYGPNINSTYQSLTNGMPASGYPFPGTGSYLKEKMESRFESPSREKTEGGPPRLFGIELKWISLLTLALQNAFLTIIMHYSRVSSSPNKTYSAASAVLLNELLKGSISSVIALRNIDLSLSSAKDPRSPLNRPSPSSPLSILASRFSIFLPSRLRLLRQAVFSRDCIQLSIPAILYVIQNNLQYTAASNLDVATFQVTYQMKILTTAAFSVALLGRRLSKLKWLALVLLAIGVGIVQIQSTTAPSAGTSESTEKLVSSLHTMSPLKGFLAVTAACMTSGLAGVYFELLLKSSNTSGSTATNAQPDLWVRNTQLSLFSLIPAIVPILFNGSSDGSGPIGRLLAAFSNFNGWAVGTVLTQTFGGLITAIVIRYSDNIMKGFATSLSIIISFLASVALFNYPITFAFVLGSSVVLAATILYNAPSSATAPTRKEIANPPGSPITASAPILGEPEKPSRASSVISLLGLGPSRPGSRAPSRAPSGENLRHMASFSNISPTKTTFGPRSNTASSTSLHSSHVYAASAPGTPYISGKTVTVQAPPTNPYDLQSGRISPPSLGPLPPRLRSPFPPSPTTVQVPAYGPGSGLSKGERKGSGSSGTSERSSTRVI